MFKSTIVWLILALCLTQADSAFAASKKLPMVHVPSPSKILSGLNHTHPRLLADQATFDRLAKLIKTDKLVAAWYQQVHDRADKILKEPVVYYHLPDGHRLLHVSRQVLNRALVLGLVWHIEHQDKYADRLWQDLHAACAFKTWHPEHFLDTAEMTAGVGIGYDWLYEHWTPEQRKIMQNALIKLGLDAAEHGYEHHAWWAKTHINWNLVCNGGISMGTLAIADKDPAFAGKIIHVAAEGMPLALASYAPDGAWPEGPGYWGYATEYAAMILSSLDDSLGTDFGLADVPGVSLAGNMPLYLTGPTGLSFNFSDAHDHVHYGPALFWLARKFHKPGFALFHMKELAHGMKPGPLDLLWFDPKWEHDTEAALPTSHYFRGTEVATMRSSWGDDVTFVGLKAGHFKSGHSDLDVGSFILDAAGQRFAIDLGSDDYNLPGYFSHSARWQYYRKRAEGHNTLVINPGKGPDQNPHASTKIARLKSAHDQTTASVNMTPSYAGHGARHIERTITVAGKMVTIHDDIKLKSPGDIWWFWHTRAEVKIAADGRSATLTEHGAELAVHLQSPADAKFVLMDAVPLPSSPHPAGQNPNNGAKLMNKSGYGMVKVGTIPKFGPPHQANAIRKLAIHLSHTEQTTIIVTAAPVVPASK